MEPLAARREAQCLLVCRTAEPCLVKWDIVLPGIVGFVATGSKSTCNSLPECAHP